MPTARTARSFTKRRFVDRSTKNKPKLPPASGSPRTPVPASPIPLVAVCLRSELLLIDYVACEDLLLIRVECSLIAYIQTVAHDGVCVDVGKTTALCLRNEFVRRQRVQRSHALGCIGKLYCESGGGQQILLLLDTLRERLAAAERNANRNA